jgi:hypothetical protein
MKCLVQLVNYHPNAGFPDSLINWPLVHALVILPFMPGLAHLSHNELNEQHFLLVSLRVHVTCVVCIQRC